MFPRVPIIQAPMAGVSTPLLAAAVSNAGGLGSIAIGAMSVAEARAKIQEVRSLTPHPFHVNVFCHKPVKRNLQQENVWIEFLAPLFREFQSTPPSALHEIYKSFVEDEAALLMLLEQRPDFVSFHFGLPPETHLRALHQAGMKTLATATNLDEALLIRKAGIDAVIAQGIEAGGHRGMFDVNRSDEGLTTASLVRLLVQNVRLPVIAAGGIMNGRQIREYLSLGAVAAQLGTAFILCPESAASGPYRQVLQSPRSHSTSMTAVISGRPARGITNRFMLYGAMSGAPQPPSYPIAYDAAKRLNAIAIEQSNYEFAAFWAGASAQKAREMPAKKLMEVLLSEMAQVT